MKSFQHAAEIKKITVNVELELKDGSKDLISLEGAESLFIVGKIGDKCYRRIITPPDSIPNLVVNVHAALADLMKTLSSPSER